MLQRMIVIAPDSFKGTASAAEVARAIATGWASVHPGDDLRLMPMADGGEGTLEAFEVAVTGAKRIPVVVTGPDDRPNEAYWLLLPDGTGVIELASLSGITLLDKLRPLDAHTLGFGQAIGAALDHGVDRLLLAIGGSSSTDGGVGALVGLGARFSDSMDRPIQLGNRGLGVVSHADLSTLRGLPTGGARILSDVTNPLLGPSGAAYTFGAQKGADERALATLELNLRRLSRIVPNESSTPGAGAAGGCGFGLMAWGATPASGASAVGETLGLPAAIAGASVVVTGEGRFDFQSAAGKVPSYVAGLAAREGAHVMLAAGLIEADTTQFIAAESLTELAGSTREAMENPLRWLVQAGVRLAESWPA